MIFSLILIKVLYGSFDLNAVLPEVLSCISLHIWLTFFLFQCMNSIYFSFALSFLYWWAVIDWFLHIFPYCLLALVLLVLVAEFNVSHVVVLLCVIDFERLELNVLQLGSLTDVDNRRDDEKNDTANRKPNFKASLLLLDTSWACHYYECAQSN